MNKPYSERSTAELLDELERLRRWNGHALALEREAIAGEWAGIDAVLKSRGVDADAVLRQRSLPD